MFVCPTSVLPVFEIFNAVWTDFDACEFALEVDSGREKNLPHRGLEPASVLRLAFRSFGVKRRYTACQPTKQVHAGLKTLENVKVFPFAGFLWMMKCCLVSSDVS